jgi:alkylation response protein AidB-like acyl-CoA dehydrogenase
MTREIDLVEIAANLGPEFGRNAAQLDETDGFVGDNFETLRAHKIFSAQVPVAYGGGGVSHSEMCEFVRTIARHCSSTALSLSMHQHLVSAAVLNNVAGRPGKQLLDKVAQSETILVSTGANDWLESSGTAKKVKGGFEITAVKPFASGSPKGNVLVTSAVFDDPLNGPQVLHFPISLISDGITFMDDWKTFGMRATGSQTLKLEAVFVPDEAIGLRRPRGGFHPAFSIILGVALPLIMSAYLGVAEAAAAIARERAKARTTDPVTPLLIGEMENLLINARIVWVDMVRLTNNFEFEPTAEHASQMLARKTICANQVIATSEKALEATGGGGFFRKLGLERLLRDAHAAQFHPLQEKRQQIFTGRLSMGLDPVPVEKQVEQRSAA